MSLYQVDKFQRDINHDRALAERWRAESGAVLERYDLSSDEREALAAWHVRKLYDMGANPLCCCHRRSPPASAASTIMNDAGLAPDSTAEGSEPPERRTRAERT